MSTRRMRGDRGRADRSWRGHRLPAAGGVRFGALAAAGIRGVWGIGFDGDSSYLGSHILASADKRFDLAVLLAVRSFLAGTLPPEGGSSSGSTTTQSGSRDQPASSCHDPKARRGRRRLASRPQSRRCLAGRDRRATAGSKTSSPFCASTRIVSPSANSPSSRRSASGFSTSRWIARLSGRAP